MRELKSIVMKYDAQTNRAEFLFGDESIKAQMDFQAAHDLSMFFQRTVSQARNEGKRIIIEAMLEADENMLV